MQNVIYNSEETILFFASIGKQFTDIMEDYMECQEEHGFDPRQGLYDLYEDLSNLYNENLNP